MKNDDVTLMILEVSDGEIVSLPTQTRKENQKNPPIILPSSNENKQPFNEDKNNSSKVEEEPKDNTPAENLEVTSGFQSTNIIKISAIFTHDAPQFERSFFFKSSTERRQTTRN